MTTRRRICSLVVAAVAGCRSIDDDFRLTRAPDLRLHAFDIRRGRDGFLELLADVEIHNPNAWSIGIDVVTFEVVLNGTALGRASAGRDLFVGAGGRRRIALPMRVASQPAIVTLIERPPPRGVGLSIRGEAKLVGRGLDLLPFVLESRWPIA